MLKVVRKDMYHLYIVGDEKLTRGEVIKEERFPDRTLILYKTNIEGIYKFCCRQEVDNWEQKAGYCWSSRAGVINKVFGTTLAEAYYKIDTGYSYEGCAIDVQMHKDMIEGCGYVVNLTPRVDTNGDVEYTVKQKEVTN